MAKQMSFAGRASSWRGFGSGPKSLDDVGHTGKHHEGRAGISAKYEPRSWRGHPLISSLPQSL